MIGPDGGGVLPDSPAAYEGILGHGNDYIRLPNTSFWQDNLRISTVSLGPTRSPRRNEWDSRKGA